MKPLAKGLLIGCGTIVLLGLAAIGATVWYVRAHGDELMAKGRAVMEEGMRTAGCRFAFEPLLVHWSGSVASGFERGVAGAKNGSFMLDGLRVGLDLCRKGVAGSLCFAPLNKAALRAGGMQHADELHYFCEKLNFTGPSVEFNVLESLWTSRVTSHVPLKDVSGLLTRDGIAEGVALLTRGLEGDPPCPRHARPVLLPPRGGRVEVVPAEPGRDLVPQRPVTERAGPERVADALRRALVEQREGGVVPAAEPIDVPLHLDDQPVDARVALRAADLLRGRGRGRRGGQDDRHQRQGQGAHPGSGPLYARNPGVGSVRCRIRTPRPPRTPARSSRARSGRTR